MLVELSIRDLALFERLSLALGPGLNVVTGETGAGKSLFVGALELLRGELPRGGAAQWVRKGASTARVEGRFLLRDRALFEEVRAWLRSELPAIAEEWEEAIEEGEPELILGRSLSREGRTRAHVQQRPVPLRALRPLAALLLEIHGQNDHQRLLLPAEQLRLLDAFGNVGPPLARYRDVRARWLEQRERLGELKGRLQEREERLDLLRFQTGELEGADIAPGEHEALAEERELLRGAGELRAELGRWIGELTEGDGAALDRARAAEHALERWHAKLPRLRAPLEDLRNAQVHLEEAGAALASLLSEVSDDPARLEVVEDRLAELERLERKYRTDDAGLVDRLASIRAELAELEQVEESLDALTRATRAVLAEVEQAADALAEKRRAVGPKLVRAVERALAALGLAKARFAVDFRPREPGDPGEAGDEAERFGPRGTEETELLLAANPGEELLPLRRVVSGGEAARIMLALRTVLRGREEGKTLVFDEIDAGVGGRLGPEVGAHLRKLAERDQVLCVTHIPAIAARAHLHLSTTKEVKRGRTRTTIAALEGEARIAEIADMIAGGATQETAKAEARRLLADVSA